MRIVSGKLKSRRITAPKNLPVRPTTDLSKESLFNVINNRFEFSEIKVLDLFSGTGNISYEFGSRGTTDITAVEAEFKCVKFIIETTQTLDLPIHVIKNDVYKFLQTTKSEYDIIFADPPYHLPQDSFDEIVNLVNERKLLKEEGLLIIEHSPNTKLAHHPNLVLEKKYGGSIFSFFGK